MTPRRSSRSPPIAIRIAEAIDDEEDVVPNTNRISAVLCSTDLDRSREFYEKTVGLTLSPETIPNHLLFTGADGSSLLVYGRPGPNSADRGED